MLLTGMKNSVKTIFSVGDNYTDGLQLLLSTTNRIGYTKYNI